MIKSPSKVGLLDHDENNLPYSYPAVAAIFFFPALGGLLFGYDIGATAYVVPQLMTHKHSGVRWHNLVEDNVFLQVPSHRRGRRAHRQHRRVPLHGPARHTARNAAGRAALAAGASVEFIRAAGLVGGNRDRDAPPRAVGLRPRVRLAAQGAVLHRGALAAGHPRRARVPQGGHDRPRHALRVRLRYCLSNVARGCAHLRLRRSSRGGHVSRGHETALAACCLWERRQASRTHSSRRRHGRRSISRRASSNPAFAKALASCAHSSTLEMR